EKCRSSASLCYLDGKTNEQAARELGWPIGSMSRRLEKARRLLQERLAGRGLGILAVLLFIASLGFVGRLVEGSPWGGAPATQTPTIACVSEDTDRLLASLLEADIPNRTSALAADLLAAAERMKKKTPASGGADWQRLTGELAEAAQQLAMAGDDAA